MKRASYCFSVLPLEVSWCQAVFTFYPEASQFIYIWDSYLDYPRLYLFVHT